MLTGSLSDVMLDLGITGSLRQYAMLLLIAVLVATTLAMLSAPLWKLTPHAAHAVQRTGLAVLGGTRKSQGAVSRLAAWLFGMARFAARACGWAAAATLKAAYDLAAWVGSLIAAAVWRVVLHHRWIYLAAGFAVTALGSGYGGYRLLPPKTVEKPVVQVVEREVPVPVKDEEDIRKLNEALAERQRLADALRQDRIESGERELRLKEQIADLGETIESNRDKIAGLMRESDGLRAELKDSKQLFNTLLKGKLAANPTAMEEAQVPPIPETKPELALPPPAPVAAAEPSQNLAMPPISAPLAPGRQIEFPPGAVPPPPPPSPFLYENPKLTALGEKKPLLEWVADPICEVDEAELRRRLVARWSVSKAIITPDGNGLGAKRQRGLNALEREKLAIRKGLPDIVLDLERLWELQFGKGR